MQNQYYQEFSMFLSSFKIKWKVVILATLPFIGKATNLATLDAEFIKTEKFFSLCQTASNYKSFANFKLSPGQVSKYISPPENCQQIATSYHQLAAQINAQTQTPEEQQNFYPYYSRLILKHSLQEFLFQNPEAKNSYSGFNPWIIENQLRQLNISKQSSCSLENLSSYQLAVVDKSLIYSNSFFHQFFIENGYTCTVQLYQKLSDLNGLTNQSEQALYENTLATLKKQNLKNPNYTSEILKKFSDSIMIYVPQLGYDLPPENIHQALKFLLGFPTDEPFRREQLVYQELKSYFNSQNIPFYVLKRTSLDPIEKQVQDSANNLKMILLNEQFHLKKQPKKIIFLARSMGGLVTRLLLKKYPQINKLTKGVVMIGATPHGSVIAEYKSRGDIHFLTVTKNILDKQPNKTIAQFVPVLKASLLRSSLETMSHEKYQPQRDKDTLVDYPVINVIFLRPEAKSYFDTLGTRVPQVDLTFLNMLTYGPTEGSSPLTHASWDTMNSVRIFDSRLNHLGFWAQNSNEGLKIYEAALTALEARLNKTQAETP